MIEVREPNQRVILMLERALSELPRCRVQSRSTWILERLLSCAQVVVRAPLPFLSTLLISALVLTALSLGISVVYALYDSAPSRTAVQMSVFLSDDLNEVQQRDLKLQLGRITGVEGLRLRSKGEALALLKSSLGSDGAALDGLEGSNPLPASFEFNVSGNPREISLISNRIAELSGVIHVAYPRDIVNRIEEQTGGTVAWAAVVLLFLVLLVILAVTNALRLSLYSQREELAVMKLVGAGRFFVQMPFLLEGIAIGFFAAALASLFAMGILGGVNLLVAADPVAASFIGEQSIKLGWQPILLTILCGSIAGGLGAYGAQRSYSEYHL